ncbi:MAG: helix-turn-helix transcriptional regulator [Lachnospiraceae bacterium]|nr:helix-turn-helix transcriptional regulator [Lachnospiraceae bacterium]
MLQKIDYGKLGTRIKELRQEIGLTQESLAEIVGCNTSHISNIENNHTKVSLNVLLTIANTLNTSIDYLLSDQYDSEASALDNEILHQVSVLPVSKKKQILRVIKAL